MNDSTQPGNREDCSTIDVEILVEEPWIDQILDEYPIEIPVNEMIVLTNLKVNLADGMLNFQADLKDKSSSIELTSRPVWDAERQYLSIMDLDLQTNTKNVLLKSAGWLAQNFLNATIDRKIEEQVNKMYALQLVKLKEKPVRLPLPKGGSALVKMSSIVIHELTFVGQAINVKATIDAHLTLNLTTAKT